MDYLYISIIPICKKKKVTTSWREGIDERNKKIVEMYDSGMSLAQIGLEFGVSRQRIQQIMDKMVPNTTEHNRHWKPPVDYICQQCGKTYTRHRCYNQKTKYCSHECAGIAKRFTREQHLEARRKRANDYYQKVLKGTEVFKQKTKERNARYKHKRTPEQNKEYARRQTKKNMERYRTDPVYRRKILDRYNAYQKRKREEKRVAQQHLTN